MTWDRFGAGHTDNMDREVGMWPKWRLICDIVVVIEVEHCWECVDMWPQ